MHEAHVNTWKSSFLSVEGGGLLLDHSGLYETLARSLGTSVNNMRFGPINWVCVSIANSSLRFFQALC